jgi:hypothetical protein
VRLIGWETHVRTAKLFDPLFTKVIDHAILRAAIRFRNRLDQFLRFIGNVNIWHSRKSFFYSFEILCFSK